MTLKVGQDDVSFKWNNYLRPTPKNLLRFSQLIQGTLLGLSTGSMFAGLPEWVPITLNISIVVVNQVVQFFGNVVEDAKTESTTAEFPSGETLTITKEEP